MSRYRSLNSQLSCSRVVNDRPLLLLELRCSCHHGVEQRHVVAGGGRGEVEVEVLREQLVLDLREEQVADDRGDRGEPPERHPEAPVRLLFDRAVQQVRAAGQDEQRVLLRHQGEAEAQPGAHHGDDPAVLAGQQVQAQQDPQHHQVVQQDLALVVHAQRGHVEHEHREERAGLAAGEAPHDLPQQEHRHQVHDQHQHPPGVDGVAERVEAAGQDRDPAGDREPAHRRVVVEVRVRRQFRLTEHGPRLLHVDALVGEVQRVAEHVPAVRRQADGQAEDDERPAARLRRRRLLGRSRGVRRPRPVQDISRHWSTPPSPPRCGAHRRVRSSPSCVHP